MDSKIRRLERQISITDDPDLIMQLDHYLRQIGQARDYYADKLIETFWEHFTLADAFRGTQQHTMFFDFPDCFQATPDGCYVGLFLNPSRGEGWRPSIALAGSLYSAKIASVIFPESKTLQQLFATEFSSRRRPSASRASNARLEACQYVVLENLYELWLLNPELLSYPDHPQTLLVLNEVSAIIRRKFSLFWYFFEWCCENLQEWIATQSD